MKATTLVGSLTRAQTRVISPLLNNICFLQHKFKYRYNRLCAKWCYIIVYWRGTWNKRGTCSLWGEWWLIIDIWAARSSFTFYSIYGWCGIRYQQCEYSPSIHHPFIKSRAFHHELYTWSEVPYFLLNHNGSRPRTNWEHRQEHTATAAKLGKACRPPNTSKVGMWCGNLQSAPSKCKPVELPTLLLKSSMSNGESKQDSGRLTVKECYSWSPIHISAITYQTLTSC